MAWTAPVSRATGYVVLAADWNNEHVGNLQYLHGDAGFFNINDSVIGAGGFFSTNPSSGIGYRTGAGGQVNQATSRNTAVTVNTVCGEITTNGTLIANGGVATFTVNNSTVAATDVVTVCVANNPVTGTAMLPGVVGIAAGSFTISYVNNSGAGTTQALAISFAVIKVVQS